MNLTAVVCTKRHHTRFYPMQEVDKQENGDHNCKPGTLVERSVTSPYFTDFYLQSHNGLKGTSMPAHYFVLVNEMNMPISELQHLVSLPIASLYKIYHANPRQKDIQPLPHLRPSHDGNFICSTRLLCRPTLRARTLLPPRLLRTAKPQARGSSTHTSVSWRRRRASGRLRAQTT